MPASPDGFRKLALALPDAVEASHHGHPDFRAAGRIFATLWPDGEHAMVMLTPDEQARFVEEHPDAFAPAAGAWGRRGCTRVALRAAKVAVVREALALARRHVDEERAARSRRRKRP